MGDAELEKEEKTVPASSEEMAEKTARWAAKTEKRKVAARVIENVDKWATDAAVEHGEKYSGPILDEMLHDVHARLGTPTPPPTTETEEANTTTAEEPPKEEK